MLRKIQLGLLAAALCLSTVVATGVVVAVDQLHQKICSATDGERRSVQRQS